MEEDEEDETPWIKRRNYQNYNNNNIFFYNINNFNNNNKLNNIYETTTRRRRSRRYSQIEFPFRSWTLVSAIIIIFLLATGTVIVGGRQSVSDDDITEQQQQHQQQTAELVHSELEEEDEESDHIDLEDRTISPLGCKLASQSIHISQDNTAQFIQLNITHPLFITSLLTKLVQGVTYSVNINYDSERVSYFSLWADDECLLGSESSASQPSMSLNWTAPRAANITFRLQYRFEDSRTYEILQLYQISQECELTLESRPRGNISHTDLPILSGQPLHNRCIIYLPNLGTTPGIVLRLNRLNVPCTRGGLQIGHQGPKLCGKLQEIPPQDRVLYFPDRPSFINVIGATIFHLHYRFVDPCYNVTLLANSSALKIEPNSELDCNYRILLPYGYRVSLQLTIATNSYEDTSDLTSISLTSIANSEPDPECNGVGLRIWAGRGSLVHCNRPGQPPGSFQIISIGNRVRIRVTARAGLSEYPAISLRYEAVGNEEIVGRCPWPWIISQEFCLAVFDQDKISWDDAEQTCRNLGGHLASIRSQLYQDIVDRLLLNSPGYRDENSYWVGATDRRSEGDFQWSDNVPFSYSNWFPGWRGGHVNKQPSDDGTSGQDCVELRRLYHLPPSIVTLTSTYRWNDKHCDAQNFFICEILASGERMRTEAEVRSWECNKTIILTPEEPRATLTSPDFPRPYPDETVCLTLITAPPAFTILLEFEELVLENEPSCSYDYVEIIGGNTSVKLCGDWSDRLKLLRRTFPGPSISLNFLSDYSHHFGGFKARISIEQAWPECGDDRFQLYNNSCYLFDSYPEVTWHTAKEICKGIKGELASVHSETEERFIVSKIRESREYSTSAIYWLGARAEKSTEQWTWDDGTVFEYTGWVSSERFIFDEDYCLGLQWTPSPSPLLPSGLYWSPQHCDMVGGYVCKKEYQGSGLNLNFNRTINGTEGSLTSPQFPHPYMHNLDYWIVINAPEKTRIVVKVKALELEPQAQCLYDYLEVVDPEGVSGGDPIRLCGHYDQQKLEKVRIVSATNVALVHFHSDYSVSGNGYSLIWQAVDVSGCPLHTTTAKQGLLTSPNYPEFLLSRLDCSTTILAPVGRRVWLDVREYDLSNDAELHVVLGGGEGKIKPYSIPDLISDGIYISAGERMQLTLRTGDSPLGKGYSAAYRTVGDPREERVVELGNRKFGRILHINYPSPPPLGVDLTQRFIAPLGNTIHLQFNDPEDSNGIEVEDTDCLISQNFIEVIDSYSDNNGTVWRLCPAMLGPQLTVESFLNTLKVRTVYGDSPSYVKLNVTLTVKPDPNYKDKLLQQGAFEPLVESCNPNPCQNGGKCVTTPSGKHSCQCNGHFTGMLCGLTYCELNPCVFGECELTTSGFRCHCKPSYYGDNCDLRHHPCSSNPCEARGDCVETKDASFKCNCHAWWEGIRCEKWMVRIPYKPLSERMLHEPFWLGLITVTVVLGVLGLFWCAKRHFPEKLEKLLAEENERGRPYMSSRCASVRERALGGGPGGLGGSRESASLASGVTGSISGGPPARSLLGRLATPSPRKKRNNSTPTKKTTSASEKKQILQQLVSPPSSLIIGNEVIPMSTGNSLTVEPSTSGATAETSFTSKLTPAMSIDQKLEKKVTFARLLDKVSSEMSSGSELEVGGTSSSTGSGGGGASSSGGGCSGGLSSRVSGNDPSTISHHLHDLKSPNSTSSNQGSDSRSSSDTHLSLGELSTTGAQSSLCGSITGVRRPGGRKTASADSILAMFRNFPGVTGSNTSPVVSPSTTPTGSTTRDDLAGSDDSSVNTPTSSSSGIADSPPMFSKKTTIQVSVLDPLSAQKSSNNFLQPPSILLEVPSKCLSPIRELPTPTPSPAITPILPRHNPMALLAPMPYKTSQQSFGATLELPKEEKEKPMPTIPVVTIEEASPEKIVPPVILPGSPPPQQHHSRHKPLLKDLDKPNSLDLPCPPPVITVTCSMTEGESDSADSPATKTGPHPGGMCYLSPFSMCSRGDRTTSESNLSSSGYSSMASPGPSRCGSNNPLCPTDVEEHHIPRRPSPLLRAPSEDNELSDDPQLESNDEGFGTDQLEEKIEDGELKSAKELELFMECKSGVKHCSSFDTGLEHYKTGKSRVKHCGSVEAGLDYYRDNNGDKKCKVVLQLPSILVDGEPHCDKHSSPVSSRSESPLSDKTGISRFSPMFYGRLTDSDGLYDCASSDCCKSKRHSGRRRERRRSKSPTKISQILLEVPGKTSDSLGNIGGKGTTPRSGKPSPKRRARPPRVSSSSSSSAESLNSIREMTLCLSGADKITERLHSRTDGHWAQAKDNDGIDEDSANDNEDLMLKMLPETRDITPRKICRMRAIGHQIRFLRRLEQSLKRSRGERTPSPERPLLGGLTVPGGGDASPPTRTNKRLSWIRQRGAVSDGNIHDWSHIPLTGNAGHTD